MGAGCLHHSQPVGPQQLKPKLVLQQLSPQQHLLLASVLLEFCQQQQVPTALPAMTSSRCKTSRMLQLQALSHPMKQMASLLSAATQPSQWTAGTMLQRHEAASTHCSFIHSCYTCSEKSKEGPPTLSGHRRSSTFSCCSLNTGCWFDTVAPGIVLHMLSCCPSLTFSLSSGAWFLQATARSFDVSLCFEVISWVTLPRIRL